MKVLTVTGIILALFFGLCILRLKIRICILQEGTIIKGKIVLRILGFLGWTFKIPQKTGKQKEPQRQEEDKSKGKVLEQLPPPGKMLDFGKTFLQINVWLIEHIKCTRFIWKTRLGIGDAAATGIGGGLLWGIKGFLLSILKRTVDSEACMTEIDVTPVFNSEAIRTEFDCIFSLRTGYIIIACFRLLLLGIMYKLVSKGVRLSERPSN